MDKLPKFNEMVLDKSQKALRRSAKKMRNIAIVEINDKPRKMSDEMRASRTNERMCFFEMFSLEGRSKEKQRNAPRKVSLYVLWRIDWGLVRPTLVRKTEQIMFPDFINE